MIEKKSSLMAIKPRATIRNKMAEVALSMGLWTALSQLTPCVFGPAKGDVLFDHCQVWRSTKRSIKGFTVDGDSSMGQCPTPAKLKASYGVSSSKA